MSLLLSMTWDGTEVTRLRAQAGETKQAGCKSGALLIVSAFHIIALIVTLQNPIVSHVSA